MKKRYAGLTIFFFYFLFISDKNGPENDQMHFNTSPYKKIINEAGYALEEHKIQTTDGYILTAWRIPRKLNEPKTSTYNKKPIILQHGILDSSFTWLIQGKNLSLPFLLAENGYDVWLTNSRGNVFSYEHLNNKEYDSNKINNKYWEFSFHEMALYDLPAFINYITRITQFEKVSYVCHSQGAFIYFILYMLNPDIINSKIEKFFGLGPVPSIYHSKSYVLKMESYTSLLTLIDKLSIKNFFCCNLFFYKFLRFLVVHFTSISFNVVNFIISNTHRTNRINIERLFNNFLYVPGGTSVKNLKHWLQVYNNKKLAQFDYGEMKNWERYNRATPPEYDYRKLNGYGINSYFYVSDVDPFSNFDDLNILLSRINNTQVTKVRHVLNYNHLDFIWGNNARDDIYNEIIAVMKE